jgi:hypothetical protein
MMPYTEVTIRQHYEHVCKKECRKYLVGQCNRRIIDCLDDHK